MALTGESTSRIIKTKNWKLHYNEAGEGPALVLLHGSGAGASGWSNFSKNIPALAEKYRVIAVDIPGWGGSQAVRYPQRDHTGALLELLDELGIEKAALVGNSMGGAISVRFAYEHPERVSHLITMGASAGVPGLSEAAGITEGLKILIKAYRNPTEEVLGELVDIMTFDSSFATPELIAERTRNAVERPDHLANFIEGWGKAPVIDLDLSRVPAITAPALLFHGRDDRVVHFENSLRLGQLIPDSRILLVNRCGHWLQTEHAEEFNRTVHHFISSN